MMPGVPTLRSKNRYCYRVKLSAYVRAYKMMYDYEDDEDDDEEDEDDDFDDDDDDEEVHKVYRRRCTIYHTVSSNFLE